MTVKRQGEMGTLTVKGQVTIPKRVREALRLQEGDLLRFDLASGKVTMTKVVLTMEAETFSDQEWDALIGLANHRGRTYDSAKDLLKSFKR